MRSATVGSSSRKCLPQVRTACTVRPFRRSLSSVVLPSTRRMRRPSKTCACSRRMTSDGPSGMRGRGERRLDYSAQLRHATHVIHFPMNLVQLGTSDLRVTPICLGTMTFGEQVNEADAHAILDRAIERGINFLDTAEMYAVPPRAETFGATETIIGHWLAARPGMRKKIVLATKVAGPSRGMPWVRQGGGLTPDDIVASCEASLRRLQTDVIDLYQIHWPERHVAAFGEIYYQPAKETSKTSIYDQLEAMKKLVRDGKVRHIGLSNETPWGVHEFVRLAEQFDLPRVAAVQNPDSLTSRAVDNGLDETMHRLGVSLLAYSPLAFGALTGKYDEGGLDAPDVRQSRLS